MPFSKVFKDTSQGNATAEREAKENMTDRRHGKKMTIYIKITDEIKTLKKINSQ